MLVHISYLGNENGIRLKLVYLQKLIADSSHADFADKILFGAMNE